MLEFKRIYLKCIGCGETKMINPIVTLEKYLMGRDSIYPTEYTEEIKTNAEKLLQQVNNFLTELGINIADISSGWRPAVINAATPNAAKKSAHQSGEAVDIKDDNYQTLANKILEKKDLLEKFDLYMEDPVSTKGQHTNWVHLQTRKTKSGRRIFLP